MRTSYVRARAPAEKADRRDAILKAALALWRASSYDAFTMARLAERARLAKGTLYLYFPTKEALFLRLLLRELDAWFVALEPALARLSGCADAIAVADALADSLVARSDLTRLFTLLEAVLERNLDEATVRAFKRELLAKTIAAGDALERALPALRPGDGVALLVSVRALVTGLRLMADPSPVVARVLAAERALAPFAVDFGAHARAGIRALVAGHAAAAPSETTRARAARRKASRP